MCICVFPPTRGTSPSRRLSSRLASSDLRAQCTLEQKSSSCPLRWRARARWACRRPESRIGPQQCGTQCRHDFRTVTGARMIRSKRLIECRSNVESQNLGRKGRKYTSKNPCPHLFMISCDKRGHCGPPAVSSAETGGTKFFCVRENRRLCYSTRRTSTPAASPRRRGGARARRRPRRQSRTASQSFVHQRCKMDGDA